MEAMASQRRGKDERMRNKILSMLLIGLLFLPASLAHAMVDPLSTVQVEIPEMNLQFLMPRAWDGYLLEAEAASATLVFVDPDDTMLQRVIMVLTFSKTEALDDELTAYRAEADALFASGEGQTMRLLSSGVLDRMDAIDAGADGGAYRVLFIDAGGGYIAIVYQDPQHVADDGYTAAVDTILGSVAQMDNAMAARPEPSDAFLVEPREGGVAISAYVGEALRVDVPEEIDGQKVVAIAERAFFEKPVQHVWPTFMRK